MTKLTTACHRSVYMDTLTSSLMLCCPVTETTPCLVPGTKLFVSGISQPEKLPGVLKTILRCDRTVNFGRVSADARQKIIVLCLCEAEDYSLSAFARQKIVPVQG